jgi:hypothetical protein
MRVAVGKKTRVGPGDEVVVQGQLPASGKLGRLYVFAAEGKGPFSPYVQGLSNTTMVVKSGGPAMRSPMSMRLVEAVPRRELSFVSDIDGYIRVMQEVDDPKDQVAKVSIKRRINPELPFMKRITRQLTEMFT